MSLKHNGTIVYVKLEVRLEQHGRRRRDLSEMTGVMVESAGRPHGVAVDWVNKNLYWVDTELNTVSLINIFFRIYLTCLLRKQPLSYQLVFRSDMSSKSANRNILKHISFL